jgi:hypothetical protein
VGTDRPIVFGLAVMPPHSEPGIWRQRLVAALATVAFIVAVALIILSITPV